MGVGWWRETEQAEEIQLLWDREQKVSPTYNLCNAHQGIVYDNSELIGPCSVGTPQDEVATMTGEIDRLPAIMDIRECYVLVRDDDACRARAGGDSVSGDITRPACPLVDNSAIRLMWSLCRHNISTCAIAGICQMQGCEALEITLVDISPCALHIALVPVEAQPSEVILYLQGKFLARALPVDVLYTQHKPPALLAC